MAIVACLVAGACTDVNDVLFTRPLVTPLEIEPGLYRVTVGPQPDLVRGFTATGDTILFRSRQELPQGETWQILGFPASGGFGAIEHGAIYRMTILPPMSVGTLISLTDQRYLTWWRPGNDGAVFGPAGCPTPNRLLIWYTGLYRLDSRDGTPLRNLPSWALRTPWGDTTVNTASTLGFRMRFTLGEQEARQGFNPFGPAVAPDNSLGVMSDGQALWRFDPAAPATFDSLGQGIYPAISSDGALLALATPQGLDSTFSQDFAPGGLRNCTQDEWTLAATGWTTAIIQLATGDTVATFDGIEPVWDPSGTRVLVRRPPMGLVWVELATGAETVVPGTESAFGAAVSRSGVFLAYSNTVGNNIDVYVRLLR